MAKNNKKTTKVQGIIISILTTLLILAGLVLVYLGVSQRIDDTVTPKASKVDEVLSLSLETDYPASPSGVVTHYYDLYECMYSAEAVDRTSDLVWQMRGLFTRELQILNPFEKQKENALNEVIQSQQTGLKFLSYEINDIYLDTANENITYIDVTEYWTGPQKIKKTYALFQEDNKWKIHRWDIIGNE